MEFIYTRILLRDIEGEILDNKKKICKTSLKGVRQIYESVDSNNKKCLVLEYHNDTFTTIYDDFERVDKLHEKYLNEGDKKGKEKTDSKV